MEATSSITSITNENIFMPTADKNRDDESSQNDTGKPSAMVANFETETKESSSIDMNKDDWYDDLADALAGDKRCDLSVVRKITNCGVFPRRLRLSAWHACLGSVPESFVLSAKPEYGASDVIPASISTLIEHDELRRSAVEPYDLETKRLFAAILASVSAGPVHKTPLSSRELKPEFVSALDVVRYVVTTADGGFDLHSKDVCIHSLFISILDFLPSNINSALQLLRLIVQYHDPELSLFLDSKKLFAPANASKFGLGESTSSRSKHLQHTTVFERWLLSLLSSDVISYDAIIPIWDTYFQYHDPYLIFFVIFVLLVNIKDTLLTQSFESSDAVETIIVNTLRLLEPSDVPDCMALAQFYSQLTPSSFRACCYSELFESVKTLKEPVKELIRLGKTPHQQPIARNVSSNNLEMKPYYYKSNMHIPVDQALCLPVTAEELLESLYMPDEATASGTLSTASNASNYSNNSSSTAPLNASTSALKFFIIDCRSSDDYNECHLSMAFHLEASLICTDPLNFSTALDTLLQHQSEVTAASAGNALVGEHICFLGYGDDPSSITSEARDQHDQYMFMVQSRLLQRGKKMISSLDGGFAEVMQYCSELDLVGREELLHGSDVHKHLAPPRSPSRSQPQHSQSAGGRPSGWAGNQPQQGWGKLFKTIVSHVKHQAEEYKEKLETYMDPYIEAAMRSPSSPGTDATPPYDSQDVYDEDGDKSADRRRLDNFGRPVLLSLQSATSEIDEGLTSPQRRKQQRTRTSDAGSYEYVNMNDFLRRLDNHLIAHFRAGEILHALSETPPVPCTLVLTRTQLIIMRHLSAQRQEQFEGRHINGSIVARRSLDAVVKITAKKQCPEVVTIKYGTVDGDEFYITDMDRFFIPEAKDAVDRIKQAVLELCESLDKVADKDDLRDGDGGTSYVNVEKDEMMESSMEIPDEPVTDSNKSVSTPVHGSTSAPALNIETTVNLPPSTRMAVTESGESMQTFGSATHSKKPTPLQPQGTANVAEGGSGDAGGNASSSPRLSNKKQRQTASRNQEYVSNSEIQGSAMTADVGGNSNDDGLFSI